MLQLVFQILIEHNEGNELILILCFKDNPVEKKRNLYLWGKDNVQHHIF